MPLLRWMLAAFLALALSPGALAFDLKGALRLALHTRDGQRVDIGQVRFEAEPGTERTRFSLSIDHAPFRDHFLSMREFKCLDGQGEILCHVPYPHPRPSTVTATDLAWLEHALLFMFKKPSDFGAKLWNGVYWKLRLTPQGIVGQPQAVDLNLIGAPPARTDVPPYQPALRDDMPEGARWFVRLTLD